MPELIHILPFVALLFALASAIFAWIAARAAQRPQQQKLYRAIVDAIEDLEADSVRLNSMYKKLNANYASLRANGKNQYTQQTEDDSLDTGRRVNETQSQHKERLRKMMREGRFKHGPDAYPGGQ